MALTEQQALAKAKETLKASQGTRAAHEASCGLWLSYTYGSQWGGIAPGRRGGQNLARLRTIISANRTDVRFAMNMIRPRVRKLNSRLMPKEIRSRVIPATRSMEDQIAALVGEARLARHLRDTNGKRALRFASLWRLVLGSVVVRRTMAAVGPGIKLSRPDGKPSVNAAGEQRRLRSFRHGWAVCPPYEFVRDPSASGLSFDDEEIIGHEKARTVEWLMRHYGVKVETEATMGQLLEFQGFLYRATGQTMDMGWRNSTLKGVMVSEWWFKDPDGEPGKWAWWMLAYRNTRPPNPDDHELIPIMFGPNPYADPLPLHHFWYDIQLIAPWGRGVPALTIQAQDAVNLAFVSMIRQLIQHSANKYVVEENSLVDKIEDALSNRCDVPIVYRKNSAKPDRLAPGNTDPVGGEILKRTPTWLDDALNMAPVQRGEAVKRGEAGEAYRIRRDAADTPIVADTDWDELTTNELLTGTLRDVAKSDTLKVLQRDLGSEFTLDQLGLFKTRNTKQWLSGVEVIPDSLRPRTPKEQREDAAQDVSAGMVDAVAARRTMLVRGRITLDEKEARAYRRQQAEIQTILSGEPVEVYLGQDHDTHQYTIALEQESGRHASYTAAQKKALQDHWTEHQEMKQVLAQLLGAEQAAVGPEQPGAEGEAMPPGMEIPLEGGMGEMGGMGMSPEMGAGMAPTPFGPPQPAMAGSMGPGTGMPGMPGGMPGAGLAAAM